MSKTRTTIPLWDRFISKIIVSKSTSCWEWQGAKVNEMGHGIICVGPRGSVVRWLTHRYAWTVFVNGPIPGGLFVCHKCDNACCCNPEHLFIGNQKDNMNDCAKKGRTRKLDQHGIKNNSAKLTEADVIFIRFSNKTTKELSEQFGVSRHYVYKILSRVTWSHI